jgi:hypothetical protein
MREKTFCAQISREINEPFIGTAPWVDTWLLIEYTGAWRTRAIEQSDLSAQVKDWIAGQYSQQVKNWVYREDVPVSTPRPRILPLFIRHHSRPLQEITCFVGIVREDRQVLYRFILNSYEELTTLDIEALRAEDPRYAAQRYDESLYLVCTHGKHDMCCARYGQPVYQALVKEVGLRAWQCSHLGGDKFAANLLYLPQSISYGRITDADIERMLAAHRQGQLYLEKCRGRTCYTPIQQAAEHFLRARTGNRSLASFSALSLQYREERGEHIVKFRELATQDVHRLALSHIRQEIDCVTSCKGCWRNPLKLFTLKGYRRLRSRTTVLVGV